jgi:hypothetical protein
MHQDTTQPLKRALDAPIIQRIRRNHALEHATIHMMSRSQRKLSVVGRSDSRGVTLIGNVPTDVVSACAEEALQRLRNGEHELAVHPNCGTNMVTTAAIGVGATLAALLGSQPGRRGRLRRLPLIAAGIMAAMAVGRPLGLKAQEHVTTLADPGDMQILEIRRMRIAGMTIHRIETTSSGGSG